MPTFLFLYPISDYLDFEIEQGILFDAGKKVDVLFERKVKISRSEQKERDRVFRQMLVLSRKEFPKKYAAVLNMSIHERYRKNGYRVVFALFDDRTISSLIALHEQDRIFPVGLTFSDHTTERPDGTFPYPDPSRILDQCGEPKKIQIAGFHLWDCVEKVARCAYRRGLETMVDEELTEMLYCKMFDPDFNTPYFPSINPLKGRPYHGLFFLNRKDKPWMWQKYKFTGKSPRVPIAQSL